MKITIEGREYEADGELNLTLVEPPVIPPVEPPVEPPPEPPVEPPSDEPTENEGIVLTEMDAMLGFDQLIVPVVTPGDGLWFGVSTLSEDHGKPGVYPGLNAAERAWRGAGRPKDGGICILPGRHSIKAMEGDNIIRSACVVRAQDMFTRPMLSAYEGWQRGNAGIMVDESGDWCVFQGFDIAGASPIHWGKRAQYEAGLLPDHKSPVICQDMHFYDSSNGIRTTGGDVALFRCKAWDNGHREGAHDGYFSHFNSKSQGSFEINRLLLIDCEFTRPGKGHSVKTRARHTLIKGGLYHGTGDAAVIDNPFGGRLAVDGAEIIKNGGGVQYMLFSDAIDSVDRDTGRIRDKYAGQEHWRVNKFRGQSSWRNCTIDNRRAPGTSGFWNDAQWRDLDGNEHRRMPVEIIGCQIKTETGWRDMTVNDVKGPAV